MIKREEGSGRQKIWWKCHAVATAASSVLHEQLRHRNSCRNK